MPSPPAEPPTEPRAGNDDPPELRALVVTVVRLLTDLDAWPTDQTITADHRLRIGALLAATRRFHQDQGL